MDSGQTQELAALMQENLSRFRSFNQRRCDLMAAAVVNKDILKLLDALPLLFAAEHPELPGGAGGASWSVEGHRPVDSVSQYLRRQFPGVPLDGGQHLPRIRMMALMGSTGTVAYTDQSDFDLWLCYERTDISAEELALFRKKCRAIEAWIVERYNAEFHFFLNDVGDVRNNIFDDEGDESLKPSHVGELLKDEFYRSSIVLAGRVPFWWLVPPCGDDEYARGLAAAQESPLGAQVIDLGNIHAVNRDEFLGAALFQILKFLGNPFKSLMKLGLLRRYLDDESSTPFLSTIIKTNVQKEDYRTESIDAYLIMFNQVFEYYARTLGDDEAAKLMRACFYLKVDPRVSQQRLVPGEATPEKIRIMTNYLRRWGWSDDTVERMDRFDTWDIGSVDRLWKSTRIFILRGYREILNSLKEKGTGQAFTPEEQLWLNRKISSYFSLSDAKVDNSLSFKTYPSERILVIESTVSGGVETWLLSKRAIVSGDLTKVVLHRAASLLAVIAWISLNRLYQKDVTRIEFDRGLATFDANFMRDLIQELSLNFSVKRIDLRKSYFLRDPFPLRGYLIINPYSPYAEKVEEIWFLYHNSWGETMLERHADVTDIIRLFSATLGTAGASADSPVGIVSSPPFVHSREFARLRQFIRDAHAFFADPALRGKKRYVTAVGGGYAVMTNKRDGQRQVVMPSFYDSEIKLLYGISFNSGVQKYLHVDQSVKGLAYLQQVVSRCRADAVMIHVMEGTKYHSFFVTDERGGVVFFRKPAARGREYLARLILFAENCVRAVVGANPLNPLAGNVRPVIVDRIVHGAGGEYRVEDLGADERTGLVTMARAAQSFILSLHLLDSGETGYAFSLPDGDRTGPHSPAELSEIAGELALVIATVPGYSYYVTDISLGNLDLALYRNYTAYAFTEKTRFELLMEQAMRL